MIEPSIDPIVKFKADLDELHILVHTNAPIPWALIKQIICGAATLLTFVCQNIPSSQNNDNHFKKDF